MLTKDTLEDFYKFFKTKSLDIYSIKGLYNAIPATNSKKCKGIHLTYNGSNLKFVNISSSLNTYYSTTTKSIVNYRSADCSGGNCPSPSPGPSPSPSPSPGPSPGPNPGPVKCAKCV